MTPEEKLQAVRDALFPANVPDGDGHYISHDAGDNLDGALYDLKRLGADQVCIDTIDRVVGQLTRARIILGGRQYR